MKKGLGSYENELLIFIQHSTNKGNVDNISRTKKYQDFFARNPEIEWPFLASIVSRNAGWNMCDLKGYWLPKILDENLREQMFYTYERANWLIFADAFPQLLIYEISKQERTSFFQLLPFFHVSHFMQREWQRFWEQKDRKRLMTALIINEQNLIQKPVLDHDYYQKKVFHSLPFLFQDWFHYSCVLLPTISGQLFGFSVHDFTNLTKRIELGKKLAWLLFHPNYVQQFKQFAFMTEPTGSRHDYERYFQKKKVRDTPFLRTVYPIIYHHRRDLTDWSKERRINNKWLKPIKRPKKIEITEWFLEKQDNLHGGILFSSEVLPRFIRNS